MRERCAFPSSISCLSWSVFQGFSASGASDFDCLDPTPEGLVFLVYPSRRADSARFTPGFSQVACDPRPLARVCWGLACSPNWPVDRFRFSCAVFLCLSLAFLGCLVTPLPRLRGFRGPRPVYPVLPLAAVQGARPVYPVLFALPVFGSIFLGSLSLAVILPVFPGFPGL